jgi:stage V sporulation protein AC
MKMTNQEYQEYVKKKSPNSKTPGNLVRAFIFGGIICSIGQGFILLYEHFGMEHEAAMTATSMTLIFLGAVLTGLKVYDKIAKHALAGTLVPITGFANSVVSPALEFKSEGLITGMSAKMFVIAGPIIVFGISTSIIYGIIYMLLT